MDWNAPAAKKAKMADPRLVVSAFRHQDCFVEDVGVYAIEGLVAMGDASGVDDPVHGDAVLLHSFEDYAGVIGSAFYGCEEFILCGVCESPARTLRRSIRDSRGPCGLRYPR